MTADTSAPKPDRFVGGCGFKIGALLFHGHNSSEGLSHNITKRFLD